jgi:hypothetical protein
MVNSFRIVAKLFLVYLICISQVQSQWLLTQPCDTKNITSNIGQYTRGGCRNYGSGGQAQVCYGDEWITYNCPHTDCRPQCSDGPHLAMEQCNRGAYYSCTSDSEPDFDKLGFDAVLVAAFNTYECEGDPSSIFVVQLNKCFNYTPPRTFYNSISVSCSTDGSEAKISLYGTSDCSDVPNVSVLPTNCTYAMSSPVMVTCLNKSHTIQW